MHEEVLSAQLHALDNVSELLQIVCKATSPREARRAIYDAWRMTELQAQVVVEMQVQGFTQMECLKLRDQLTGIREFIASQDASQGS